MKRTFTVIGIALGIVLILVSLIVFTNEHLNLAKEKKVMTGFETLMAKEELTGVELIQYIDANIAAVSEEKAVALGLLTEIVFVVLLDW